MIAKAIIDSIIHKMFHAEIGNNLNSIFDFQIKTWRHVKHVTVVSPTSQITPARERTEKMRNFGRLGANRGQGARIAFF
jgi:hypothetical protein